MTEPRRVLLVALDSLDFSLLDKFMAAGKLPNLAAFAEGTTRLGVTSNGADFHGSIWSTFAAGAGPGYHGRYWWAQWMAGEDRVVRNEHPALQFEPFWAPLAESGHRVVLVDVPYVPVVEHPGVRTVMGWGTHDELTARSHPAPLLKSIRRQYGRHPLAFDTMHSLAPAQKLRMARAMREGTAMRCRLLEDYASRRDWDLFAIHFSEIHKAGHYLALPQQLTPKVDNEGAMLAILRPFDAAWPRIVEAAGEDCDIFLMALHGMSGQRDFTDLGHQITRLAQGLPPVPEVAPPDLIRRVRDLLPLSVQEAIWRYVPAKVRANRFNALAMRGFGPDDRVLIVPIDGATAIRLRLQGRERGGLVTPEEGEALIARVAELARGFTVDGAELAFEPLARPPQRYPGRNAHHLPDALLPTNPELPAADSVRDAEGRILTSDSAEIRNGRHTGRGFCFFRPGTAASVLRAEVDCLDFAPTLLSRFGVDPMPHFEGQSFLA
ncbi:MAG: alkaline phosphatase family protein [Chloroflexi bacterium]|nr:alkaline phosphatase family protein [Chloroflexota bacterium]